MYHLFYIDTDQSRYGNAKWIKQSVHYHRRLHFRRFHGEIKLQAHKTLTAHFPACACIMSICVFFFKVTLSLTAHLSVVRFG